MFRRVLMLLILTTQAISDFCERYTFEENFNEWLTNEWGGDCVAMPFWVIGKYSDLVLSGQNVQSTSFIMPQSEMSCVSSFMFTMNVGGTIEVNIYMEATDTSDQIIVLAYLLDPTGDRVTGQALNLAMDSANFVSGWHTLTMTLTGSETYEGYISIMGMASPDSIVLVDSFRYIPPGMDEAECELYEQIAPPDPVTVPTPDPITIFTPDPIATPDPITVSTPDPITVSTPDPVTVSTPDLMTVSTPDPITTPIITTATDSETTKSTSTDLDDIASPTPYPCPTPPIDEDSVSFWTPLTITMLALLYLIVLVLICLLFYGIGRRRAKAAAAADNIDFESLPSSFKVPRVKTVYPDATTNPYARRSSW